MKTLIFVVAVIVLGLVTFSGLISKSVDEAPSFKSFFGDDTPTTSTTPTKQIKPNQTGNFNPTSTKPAGDNFNPGAFRGPTSPPHVNGPSAPPPAY